jgi:hypothetical protein
MGGWNLRMVCFYKSSFITKDEHEAYVNHLVFALCHLITLKVCLFHSFIHCITLKICLFHSCIHFIILKVLLQY